MEATHRIALRDFQDKLEDGDRKKKPRRKRDEEKFDASLAKETFSSRTGKAHELISIGVCAWIEGKKACAAPVTSNN